MPPTFSFSSASRTSSTLLGRTIALTSFISCLQHALQPVLQRIAVVFDELLAGLGQVQHVNRLAPFGRDQREVEVAPLLGYHPADAVKQTGGIVCDDFENRVLLRMFVVEGQPRRLGLPGGKKQA